ncbi:MAG: cell division protein FtsZ [Buchnera aphidicola (Chaetogeoica yunlongensis)]
MFESKQLNNNAIIKVIGIGGGGGNAIEYMVKENIEGVEFFAVNTDSQALRKIKVDQTIQIGTNITKGLGAGSNPEIGKNAAEEDKENLKSILEGADMVFIAAGMGGGTGTGAAPIIAKISKKLGILTVAIVTKPFHFEGTKRMNFAEQGICELSEHVDSIIIIPNDKLLKVLSKGISLLEAFDTANNVLKGAVQGISELITKPGLINVDFADVKTVMSKMGHAMMGTGISSGEERAKKASEIAISSPLLEDIDLSGAKGVLVNITSGLDIKLDEFETIGNTIRSFSSNHATIVIGTSLDTNIENTLRVTIVATGIGKTIKQNTTNPSKDQPPKNVLLHSDSIKPNQISYTQDYSKKNIYNEFNKNSKIDKNTDYLDIPAFLRKKYE